jgi:hypothetical protein
MGCADLSADKHVLILSDHGMGWPGGKSEPGQLPRIHTHLTSSAQGNMLYLKDLDDRSGDP